jgi:hypothetical protein
MKLSKLLLDDHEHEHEDPDIDPLMAAELRSPCLTKSSSANEVACVSSHWGEQNGEENKQCR